MAGRRDSPLFRGVRLRHGRSDGLSCGCTCTRCERCEACFAKQRARESLLQGQARRSPRGTSLCRVLCLPVLRRRLSAALSLPPSPEQPAAATTPRLGDCELLTHVRRRHRPLRRRNAGAQARRAARRCYALGVCAARDTCRQQLNLENRALALSSSCCCFCCCPPRVAVRGTP